MSIETVDESLPLCLALGEVAPLLRATTIELSQKLEVKVQLMTLCAGCPTVLGLALDCLRIFLCEKLLEIFMQGHTSQLS